MEVKLVRRQNKRTYTLHLQYKMTNMTTMQFIPHMLKIKISAFISKFTLLLLLLLLLLLQQQQQQQQQAREDTRRDP